MAGTCGPRYQAPLGDGPSLKLRFMGCERESQEEAELPRPSFPSGAWEREAEAELGIEKQPTL